MRRISSALCLALLALLAGPGTILAQEPPEPEVVVERAHLFVVPEGGALRILEDYRLVNEGDVEARSTLTFTLPPGARDLRFDGPGLGERFTGTPERFAGILPVAPGEPVTVRYVYRLPYRAGLTITRTLAAPIRAVALIVDGEGVGVEGAGVTALGPMETEMGAAFAYAAGPLAPGEILALTFGPRRADAQGQAVRRDPNVELGVGLVAVGAALGAAGLLWRAPGVPPPPEHARPLIREIAALDGAFASGEVAEGVYRERRAALKEELRALLARPEVGGGD